MFKSVILVVAVSLCIMHTFAVPLPEEIEGGLLRQKRVTCDLLSFEAGGVAVNHSACAAHCLVLGRSGGSCQNGVCVCRR